MRIGILFGGPSREREVSFAGGRTVYDLLDKSLFTPVPLFIDSFGQIIELDWPYLYKGSIRDFYPPQEWIRSGLKPENISYLKEREFTERQLQTAYPAYAEQLGALSKEEQRKMAESMGRVLDPGELAGRIDFAFLCLHGPFGEDGSLQGLLEFLGIPYSGSGIFGSALGMNKVLQKEFMHAGGFPVPEWVSIEEGDWSSSRTEEWYKKVQETVQGDWVIKPANQGSSLGVSILENKGKGPGLEAFKKAVEQAFFRVEVSAAEWKALESDQKVRRVAQICDPKAGIGAPLRAGNTVLYNALDLLAFLEKNLTEAGKKFEVLVSHDRELAVLVESRITGKEFSCIVVRDEEGQVMALPPTEIRKGGEVFDYRSKYLPGLSRKITPMDVPDKVLQKIRTECVRLFRDFHFDCYARLDGFLSDEGTIYLNDPNTTSGMMPSSFFFHQAAEVGLNPSEFISFVIRSSLEERKRKSFNPKRAQDWANWFDEKRLESRQTRAQRIKVAVILGGYSTERHISVESGRNIYEKLSASPVYEPIPVFLRGKAGAHELYTLPVNVLLKDNADDIWEKIRDYAVPSGLQSIRDEAALLRKRFGREQHIAPPVRWTYEELKREVEFAFIALHGRPGEDGEVQEHLQRVGLPYNGSGPESSRLTIDKYQTNEVLERAGIAVARHRKILRPEFEKDPLGICLAVTQELGLPLIVKPVDDGCSSAVKRIKSAEALVEYGKAIFRRNERMPAELEQALALKPREEFPMKEEFLVEELISVAGADRLIEVTGGLLVHEKGKGKVEVEMLEPSETLTSGDVLSLEEKFLAGEGQNITPARYHSDAGKNRKIAERVKEELRKVAELVQVRGYCRIDAFVRIWNDGRCQVVVIEVNSLPGMTPATCIFHQAALNAYTPYYFIDTIIRNGKKRLDRELWPGLEMK